MFLLPHRSTTKRSLSLTAMFTSVLFTQLLTLANLTSNFNRLPTPSSHKLEETGVVLQPQTVDVEVFSTPCAAFTGCSCKTTSAPLTSSALTGSSSVFTVFCGVRSNISIEQVEALQANLKATLLDLSIQKANVRQLYGQPFIGFSQLRTLSLAINQISSISEDVFTGLLELSKLDLSINLLTQLPEGLLRNMPKLESLDLSRNELTELPVNFFQQLSYLRELDLSQNAFTSIPRNLLNLVRLEKLNLAKNGIVSLTTSTFSNYLPFLQVVDFSENLIREVDEATFSTTPALHTVDLRNNLLPYINFRAFSTITALKALYMAENPFICDCKLQAFKLWTEQNGTNVSWDPACPIDSHKICGPKCSFPSHFSGTYLLTVEASRLICTTTSSSTTSTTTTSTTTTSPTTSTTAALPALTTVFGVQRFAALDNSVKSINVLYPHRNDVLFSTGGFGQTMDEKLATIIGITIGAIVIGVVLLAIAAWYIRAHRMAAKSARAHRHFSGFGDERNRSSGAGSASGESTEKSSDISGPATVVDTSAIHAKSHTSSDDSLYKPAQMHHSFYQMNNTFSSSLRGPAVYSFANDRRGGAAVDPTNKHLQALLNAVLGGQSTDQRSLVGSNSQSSPPSDKVFLGMVSPNSSAFLNNNIVSMLPGSEEQSSGSQQSAAAIVPVLIQQQQPSKVAPPTLPRSESLV